jgi:hypothetical protein
MITDRYALEAPLEQGRFGTIYRGLDRRLAASTTRADVAVWVLPPEFVMEGPALAAFKRDLERVRGLSHPNIAAVLAVDHEGGALTVATELGDAETLRSVLDALRPERLDVSEADTVIEDIGAALAHAHQSGIAHGDVRPENILVTGENRIKLANFMLGGLARNTFFAPTPSDDTRALALLAYELYSGAPLPLRPGKALKLSKGVPRRRLRAIEVALSERGAGQSVGEFLAAAGLVYEGPRLGMFHGRRGSAPSPASRRIVLPAALLAAIGVGVYALDDAPWAATAVADLRDWIATGPAEEAGPPAQAAAPTASPADETATAAANTQVGVELRAATLTGLMVPSGAGASNDAGVKAPGEPSSSDAAPESAPSRREVRASAKRDTKPSGPAEASVAHSLPRLALSAASLTAYESQGVATIAIVRDGALAEPVDIIWWTSDGSAQAGNDYASFGRRVESLGPGETVRRLHIPLASDQLAEDPEYFYVHLDPNVRNARIGGVATAKIHIVDDDL